MSGDFDFGPLMFTGRPGIGVITLFGFGWQWRDRTRHRDYYSERNGRVVQFRVGRWAITPIPRIARRGRG